MLIIYGKKDNKLIPGTIQYTDGRDGSMNGMPFSTNGKTESNN